jgi:ABC-type uncharacterized transport system permease subunit
MKVIASALLIASGPLGWWVGYAAFKPEDERLVAWITGIVWLGVVSLLVAAAWRYPRAVGWGLIAVGLLLMLWSGLVVAVSGWDERSPDPWVWGHAVWFVSVGVAPFAAGVLFAIEGSLASRRRQRSLWDAPRS